MRGFEGRNELGAKYQDIDAPSLRVKKFKTHDFEVLIGATKVLGETFEMNIAEVSKTGGFELAREQIAPQQRKITKRD